MSDKSDNKILVMPMPILSAEAKDRMRQYEINLSKKISNLREDIVNA